MTEPTMTEHENYYLDVCGYFIVRHALSHVELNTYNSAFDQVVEDGSLPESAPHRYPFLQLRDHPVLARYLEEILGEGYFPDEGPELIGDSATGGDGRLCGGGEWVDWSRAYLHQGGVRLCQALRVYWALTDIAAGDGGLVLIPASHNAHVETPEDVLTGANDMALTVQPTMRAGDLLLCAESVVRGVRPWTGKGPSRTLAWNYLSARVPARSWRRPAYTENRSAEWASSLTPVEQAVLFDPNRTSTPGQVVTDGETCWLEEREEIHHPSIYIRSPESQNPDSRIDEKEFYHYDLCGHLVIRGVMDEEWLAQANEAIDLHYDRRSAAPSSAGHKSRRLAGTHGASLPDLWTLPEPYCEPFRRMIAHPALIQRLNWIMGSGFECMGCNLFAHGKGGVGHYLHSGTSAPNVNNHYRLQNGRLYAEHMNVAWQLRDVTPEDGGFCCIPGSHKGRYPLPEGIASCDDDPMQAVQHVAMKAGGVLLFLSAAQTHGAFPWRGELDRRAAFSYYRGRNLR